MLTYKEKEKEIPSLKKICVEKIIDDKRKPNDVVIDDLSTDDTFSLSSSTPSSMIPKEPLSSTELSKIFSNKGRKRGMQRQDEAPVHHFKSISELEKAKNTIKLSSLEPIRSPIILKTILDHTTLFTQVLRALDRTVITASTKETCRSLFLKIFSRIFSAPIYNGQICTNYFRKFKIESSLLFIMTTPRALFLIKSNEPEKLHILYYDGTIAHHPIKDVFTESNQCPWKLLWTEDGRYVSMIHTDIVLLVDVEDEEERKRRALIYSFDLFLKKTRDTDHLFKNLHRYTTKPVGFIRRVDSVLYSPILTEDDPEFALNESYRYREAYVTEIRLCLIDARLHNHEKFKKLMGMI
jgi:hypothetical protein